LKNFNIGQSKNVKHSGHIKEISKFIGYFSYTNSGTVLCEGDACIIAGTEERMQTYLNRSPNHGEKDIIKKTRFGEIMSGLGQGGSYAFDEESYSRFFDLLTMNGIGDGFPAKSSFSKNRPADGIQFVIIKTPW
jgi:hypothetical protein